MELSFGLLPAAQEILRDGKASNEHHLASLAAVRSITIASDIPHGVVILRRGP